MTSICVFCGSNPGLGARYLQLASEVGELLARRHVTLVYGGGRVGLMGALADSALRAGGRVIGVIPQVLIDKEVGHAGLSELRVVTSMSERKRVMCELADAFLTLPGSIGTLDELFEAWTWTQLGLHSKHCGLLNFDGYYDALIAFLDGAVREQFLGRQSRGTLLVDTDAARLVETLLARVSEAT